MSFLKPNEIQQYMFKLEPKMPNDSRIKSSSSVMGKLDIVWRGNLGEVGRLQTTPLESWI
eukprot:TRINITY_DN43072_c0_g1_i1.p1 TRINITY_DN43072_c0_g1~~TRINITY_DN43072_c0_g1_i1.p1  ORF type:complete len:60 (-),score=8.24 TRINITY_DN43072_c0_g1_i1:191-370(-)